MMTTSIKLLTLNTWKCDGEYPQRLDALKQDKDFVAADIVFLQEVFRSDVDGLDTLQQLSTAIGHRHVIWHTARLKTRQIGNEKVYGGSGLVTITRFPVLSQGVFCLHPVNGDMQRIAQWSVLGVNNERVLVVNLHLSHIDTSPSSQRSQFNQVRRFADSLNHSLLIIAGDMNCQPKELDNDSFQAVFNLHQPSTLNLDEDACLDHIYAHSERFSTSFGKVSLLYDQQTDHGWVSDHKGVGVVLRLQ